MRSFSSDPRRTQRERYEREVGRLPDDPPDEARWQWEYTGGAADREKIELIHELTEAEMSPEQETLF